ncbi:hypothetical protein NDU88_002933 [Pleurodeles waltl]|uniref:Uncharacterized protein n=1 Tax=Pleurodeles waltl TaxID=8319 RepID=A0AAV7L2P3_PLEWA|nr:hypothetical protein NDU88_002933 [Pleurodeles waltl]
MIPPNQTVRLLLQITTPQMSSRFRDDTMGRTINKLPGRDKLPHSYTPLSDGSSTAQPSEVIPPTEKTTPVDKLDLILQEIRESKATMEIQRVTLAADISIIRDEHYKLTDRVQTTENTLATLEPGLAEQTSIMTQLCKQVEHLQEHVEDAEGRACRNNVCNIGMPEGMEGAHTTQFIEEWLHTVVPPTGLSTLFTRERAHRVPTRKPMPAAPLQPIVAKMLNCRVRDKLLRVAREKAPLLADNTQCSLLPDYNVAVQQRRPRLQM